MTNLDVIVLGGAAVDLVAQVEELPQRDSLVLARAFERFPGGSAANVAVGLARLGRRVGFVGKLGDDEHGQLLLAAFEQERVDTRGVIVETGRPTATCFIAVDGRGGEWTRAASSWKPAARPLLASSPWTAGASG
jgi:ribokinase